MREYKSINSLMKHMRAKSTGAIKIYGSRQKRLLRHDGYYHGYKGHRFYKNASKLIPYSNYDEIHAVIEYDMELKAAFYQQIMFIETALKNMTLEVMLEHSKSNRFAEIYKRLIHDPTKTSQTHHLRQRDNVYTKLTAAYSHSPMIQHFYNRDDFVPIWAIFEILTLGDFGNFVSALKPMCRQELSIRLGLNQSCDTSHELFHKFIFVLKDLRNAIAHNSVIFDCRFNSGYGSSKTGSAVLSCLRIDTGIQNLSLSSIYDYSVLVVYILNRLGIQRKTINQFIRALQASKMNLESKVDRSITSVIIPTSTNRIIADIKNIR